MFENLTDKLERSFKILKGEGRITEINIAETLKEIRRALIDADVNYKVAKTFTDEVKQKALGQNVLTAVKPGQMMTKIVRDELAQLMGGTATDIRLEGTPAVILIAGLQGSGKTTFSGKLASMLKNKRGRHVLLVAGDVYRPAAADQLATLGGEIGVPVFRGDGAHPVDIAKGAIQEAVDHLRDVVIVDTAGRLHTSPELMRELAKVVNVTRKRAANMAAGPMPVSVVLVIDAATGQNGLNQALEFNEALGLDGIIMTKLDGTAKGGIAMAVAEKLKLPILRIGVGEQVDDLQEFNAKDFCRALVGESN